MSDVSCRTIGLLFREAKKKGIPRQQLTRDVPYELKHLMNEQEWISWGAYLTLMRNAHKIWTNDEIQQMGGAFLRSPLNRPFAVFARLLFSPKQFYRWGFGHQGRSALFSCLVGSYEELSSHKLRIGLTVADGYELPPVGVFLITKGVLTDMPRMVGLSSANVEMTLDGRGASFIVEVPQGGGLIGRFLKALAFPFTARAAARELEAALQIQGQRYEQLDAARRVVDRQARELRAAYSISQSVLGDLDLESALTSITRSLVEIAGFQCAQLEVSPIGAKIAQIRAEWGTPGSTATIEKAITVRGQTLGALTVWPSAETPAPQAEELLGVVLPVLTMAIANALAYTSVVLNRNLLEDRVRERTKDLADTIIQLRDAQSARDRMFANINHEIRTPLSLILLLVEELQQSIPSDSADFTRLQSIGRSAKSLLHLVDGVLILATKQESRLELNVVTVDFTTLVRHITAMYAPAARSAGVTLKFNGPENTLFVPLDEAAIGRVIGNLISNAIKFTPAGGTVTVRLTAQGKFSEVSVEDTGVGINPATSSKLFERFTQDAAPVRPGARGSGIGLAIVKELVEAHRGEVFAEKNSDQPGATFRFTLPSKAGATSLVRRDPGSTVASDFAWGDYLQGTEAPAPLPQMQRQTPTRRHRELMVLVAEDEPELLAAITRLLEPHYRVLGAPTGNQALELAKAHLPDILISDISMPGMGGIELTRHFREVKKNRLAPVILLTADASQATRLSAFESGAVDYLTKPFSPAELLARMRAQLSIRHLALRLLEYEKLTALGTMSSGLAHEIRNPANALVNAIDPLREQIPADVLQGGVKELFDVVADCAKQLAHLAKHMLSFLSAGDLETTFEPAIDIAEQSLRLAGAPLTRVHLQREFEYAGRVNCARPLIAQALTNLLENAAHAAGLGGWVKIATRTVSQGMVFEISDSGPGVPVDLRERIFEPFFTTKAPGRGTGLGLSLARQIALQNKGTLTIVDVPLGALFRLQLPNQPPDVSTNPLTRCATSDASLEPKDSPP